MSEGTVRLEVRGRVATITLDRQEKLNALAGNMRVQLHDAVVAAARDDAVSALVLTGAGRGFCAGGDVDRMLELHASSDHGAFHRILHQGAECVLALQAFPGLTIAAVNGVAAGAGLALALNCDLRLGARSARLAASWSGIGLAPDWAATFWLPRILGYGRALQMVLGAEVLDAERAFELGLLSAVVEDSELLERTHETVSRLDRFPQTARQVKTLLRKGLGGSLEACLAAETEAQEDLFAGPDVATGLSAFAAARKSAADDCG